MKKELDAELCKEFPLLYADRGKSMQESCMYWGLSVGDGWYGLIRELSEKLEPLIEQQAKVLANQPCYNCGCNKWTHRTYNPLGVDDINDWTDVPCQTIHNIPYKVSEFHGYTIPQWSRDMKQAWEGKYWWNNRSRIYRLYKMLTKLLREEKRRIAYKITNKPRKLINKLLRAASELGIHKKVPCKCQEYKIPHARASQVKEKFGGLCFYLDLATDEMYEIKRKIESKSYTTCEMCGNVGQLRKEGWWKTLCDSCNENKYKR